MEKDLEQQLYGIALDYRKKVEVRLVDELIEAMERNIEKNDGGYYTGEEIINWLKRQKEIILED